MHKIKDAATLAELAVFRAMFGVELIKIEINPAARQMHAVIATLVTAELTCIGTGETEAEALDDAFARLQHRIGSVAIVTQEVRS